MKNETILIAGGGIGGLTAANALRLRGFETLVVERSRELRPIGAGLTLQANAVRALSLLGLETEAMEAGWPVAGGEIRRSDGRRLGGMGFMDGAPMIGIHRAKLQAILLRDAGEIHTGRAVTGFKDDGEVIEVHLADDTSLQAALLVGADGIHSAVRSQLHGASSPRYAGYTCWRGIASVPAGELDVPEIFEFLGRGHRFGGVRISAEKVYWFAVSNAPAETPEKAPAGLAHVAEIFANYASPIPELIAATAPESVLHNDIVDHPPLARWGKGRVTLLGDAAHAMTPNMGQGACQAIEDALVLADRLASADDLTTGLRRYENDRIERANSFVVRSWRFGRMAQWSNPFACVLRNGLMAATPDAVVRRQMLDLLTMTEVDEEAFRSEKPAVLHEKVSS